MVRRRRTHRFILVELTIQEQFEVRGTVGQGSVFRAKYRTVQCMEERDSFRHRRSERAAFHSD